ncbi:caspase, EACC1-associated type [Streptomyces brasiliensis]|uniref:Novel STAND NTPase 1 domain-containing protein n=1 Tax=Streptomyces brasiliensis TaxID=1954 RepID=A0A917PD12_9ACTN|nr:WD40 repeat domain-containing protein [Streptomyces brasiliensis]GGJ71488.1 hypothetical protein GCM10010121_097650 [Streptomyces brasiliensis]
MTGGDLASGGARAVLVGTGSHTPGSELEDLPAVDATLDGLRSTLLTVCGMDPAHVTRVPAGAGPAQVVAAVEEAVAEARDGPVLFCHVGHGLLGPGDELYLATRGARSARHIAEAVAYRTVRGLLGEAPQGSLVVLDCCFSGVAEAPPAGGGHRAPFATARPKGSFLLTSASHYAPSFAPEGEPHTLFTGRLLRLLDEGDPAGPLLLTADRLHLALDREFADDPRVHPARRSDGTLGSLVIARNRAYRVGRPPSRDDEPPADVPCPYPGLKPFHTEDSAYFFGREELTKRLVAMLGPDEYDGPVMLVGSSGAGKSSLLRAGLLGGRGPHRTALQPAQYLPAPGARPMRNLTELWAEATGREAEEVRAALDAGWFPGPRPGRNTCRLLVVDQFEEVFTRCRDPQERTAFISLLTGAEPGAGQDPDPRAGTRPRVVLGLRADHYGGCLDHPGLEIALAKAQLAVPPLREPELRAAVESPATAVGLLLEPGLTDRLMQDLREGRSPDETAGALPFLAHALGETWLRRRGVTLTLAGYQATGGIWESVAVTTKALYESLDGEGQSAMRELLLRLVYLPPDGGAAVVRHQVSLAELPPGTEDIRDQLLAKRLLTAGQGTVQIAHESLLRTWPRLRQWIEENTATLMLRQQLTIAAAEWDEAGRDATYLYRGSRLQAAADLARARQLPILEREFVAVAQEVAEEEAQRERRRVRVLRRVLAGLAGALCLTLLAAALAFHEQRTAEAQQRAATARALLAEADSLRADDPRTALRLGLAAHALHPGAETRHSLFTTLARNPFRGLSELTQSQVSLGSPAFTADAGTLAIAQPDDGVVSVWNTGGYSVSHTPLATLPCRTSAKQVQAPAFGGPHDRLLASTCGAGGVDLWDVSGVRKGAAPHLATLHTKGMPGAPEAVAVSRDGRLLAVTFSSRYVGQGAMALWDLHNPHHPRQLSTVKDTDGDKDLLESDAVRFSPDGRHLVTAGSSLRIWDVSDPARPWPQGLVDRTTETVAFSPDGDLIAVGDFWNDRTVKLIDATSPGKPKVLSENSQTDRVESLVFSPNGRTLASGGADHRVVLWDVGKPEAMSSDTTLTGQNWPVDAVAFTADGSALMSLSSIGDEVVRWDMAQVRQPAVLKVLPSASDLAVAHGGTLLAAARGTTLSLWSLSDPAAPRRLATPTAPRHADRSEDLLADIALNTDGTLLAGVTVGGQVILWDTTRPSRPRVVGMLPADDNLLTASLAFAPHRPLLALGAGPRIRMWDVSDPAHPRERAHTDKGVSSVVGDHVSFTPDGSRLLFGGTALWDYASGKLKRPPVQEQLGNNGIGVTSPDGSLVAAAPTMVFSPSGWSGVQLWRVSGDGEPRAAGSVEIPGPDTPDFNQLAFNPDGALLASAAEDGTVRLWAVATPGQPYLAHTLNGFPDEVDDVVMVGPHGRTLIATSGGNAFILDLGDFPQIAAEPLGTACRAAGGGFDREDWKKRVPDIDFHRTCPKS